MAVNNNLAKTMIRQQIDRYGASEEVDIHQSPAAQHQWFFLHPIQDSNNIGIQLKKWAGSRIRYLGRGISLAATLTIRITIN